MHYLLFIIVSFIWGSSFILMKKAGFAFGPISIGALGTLGGAAVLWAAFRFHKNPWKIRKSHLPAILAVSLFGYVWPFTLQPFLIEKTGHGFIGMMVSFVPLLTILVSIPILKTYPTRLQLGGVLMGILCIGLIMADGIDRNVPPLLLCLAITVPLFYAIANSIIRKNFQSIPVYQLVAVLMSVSGVILTPFALIFEDVKMDESFQLALWSMIVLAVIGRGFATLLFYKLIKEKGPLFAGLVTYVVPLGALLWSWLDHETITSKQIFALGGVLLIVIVVQRDIIKSIKKAGLLENES